MLFGIATHLPAASFGRDLCSEPGSTAHHPKRWSGSWGRISKECESFNTYIAVVVERSVKIGCINKSEPVPTEMRPTRTQRSHEKHTYTPTKKEENNEETNGDRVGNAGRTQERTTKRAQRKRRGGAKSQTAAEVSKTEYIRQEVQRLRNRQSRIRSYTQGIKEHPCISTRKVRS